MPRESPSGCLSNAVPCYWLPPTKTLSCFHQGCTGTRDQQRLLLDFPQSHADNPQSSGVVNWDGGSCPRKMSLYSTLASGLDDQFLRHWPKSDAWPQPSLLKEVTLPNLPHERTSFSSFCSTKCVVFLRPHPLQARSFFLESSFQFFCSFRLYPNSWTVPQSLCPLTQNPLVSVPLLNSPLALVEFHLAITRDNFSTIHLNSYLCVLWLFTFSNACS